MIKSSGKLSTSDIKNEFGGNASPKLSDYYSGKSFVQPNAVGINGLIPTSGLIKFSQFYGAAKYVGPQSLSLLLVGGGGAGGCGYEAGGQRGGGGGGSGGYIQTTSTITKSQTLTVVVGSGGLNTGITEGGNAGSGGSTSISGTELSLSVSGGQGGGNAARATASFGVGGVGGSPNGTNGGDGNTAGNGGNGGATPWGTGGIGQTNIGAGGSGSGYGSGGGGGGDKDRFGAHNANPGGDGAKGLVQISYPTTFPIATSVTGATYSTSGGNHIYTFTSNGSITW